jgi:hypothetical protein
MYNQYIYPVRPDIIREIGKRGVFENKKNKDGKVVRKKNEHGSSCFGWGTIDDTIPTHKRDLENIRRNLDSVINQIACDHYLEKKPMQSAKRVEHVEIVVNEQPKKKSRIPNMIQDWHAFINDKFESGQIGFIPECFQESVPPLDEFMETNSGQILANFCKFNKMNY